MFPPAEAKGEGALVDPVLRFQLGQIAFDRRLAVGALIIGLRAQLVRPVDPLARDRESGADTRRTGVAAALRRADLPLDFPVLPEFPRRPLTAGRRRRFALPTPPFRPYGNSRFLAFLRCLHQCG